MFRRNFVIAAPVTAGLAAAFWVFPAAPARAQQAQSAAGNPAIVIANDKLELTVSATGGTFRKLLLRGAEEISPLHSLGHFLCLDGFGAPSAQEQATGIPFHGEASKQPFKVLSQRESGAVHSVTLQASLPLAQERLTRTIEVNQGEQVVYVSSELESALAVDRPVSWAEHATIGPPFLEKGKVVVDTPAINCRVRPYKPGPIPGRLEYGRDFRWPMAPISGGGQADIRLIPADKNALDLASCQMDPQQRLAFVTALHLEKRLLFGYVFRREDYPWVMSWMNFTGDDRAARGMEFSTQPFDISHKETVEMNPLFGTPTFKWLPAKAKIQTRFLMFYTAVPEGFVRVDRVELEGGKLTIEDQAARKKIELPAAQGL